MITLSIVLIAIGVKLLLKYLSDNGIITTIGGELGKFCIIFGVLVFITAWLIELYSGFIFIFSSVNIGGLT